MEEKSGFLQNMSAKDKNQLSYLAMFVFCILTIFVGFFLIQSLDSIDEETERYKSALELISTEGPKFLEEKSSTKRTDSHKKFTEEMLAEDRIKLTSFVAKFAEKEEVKVGSYDEKEIPFSNDNAGPIVTEHRLTAKISKTNMDNLINFLDAIEKSREPVFIQRIDIRKRGKTDNQVKATIIVSTFSKAKEES